MYKEMATLKFYTLAGNEKLFTAHLVLSSWASALGPGRESTWNASHLNTERFGDYLQRARRISNILMD